MFVFVNNPFFFFSIKPYYIAMHTSFVFVKIFFGTQNTACDIRGDQWNSEYLRVRMWNRSPGSRSLIMHNQNIFNAFLASERLKTRNVCLYQNFNFTFVHFSKMPFVIPCYHNLLKPHSLHLFVNTVFANNGAGF